VDTVQLLIDVLGPVVAIVTIGALVASRLGLEAATLSKLAYWILGPAFVFEIFSTTTLEAQTALKLVLASTTTVAAAGLVAVALTPLFDLKGAVKSATVMSSAYGNVGNAGLAICGFALGEDALDEAGVVMVTIMFFGTLLSVWLGTRQSQSAARAARDALVSPMVVAAMVGFGFNLTQIDSPKIIDRAVETTASGLIPVMLLTLGLQLATCGSLRFTKSAAVITIAKLVVAPAIGWAIAEALGLSGIDRGVVILQAAMPPAVFCMVLAIEHDLEPDRTTNDVVVVTIAALVTLPVALMLVT